MCVIVSINYVSCHLQLYSLTSCAQGWTVPTGRKYCEVLLLPQKLQLGTRRDLFRILPHRTSEKENVSNPILQNDHIHILAVSHLLYLLWMVWVLFYNCGLNCVPSAEGSGDLWRSKVVVSFHCFSLVFYKDTSLLCFNTINMFVLNYVFELAWLILLMPRTLQKAKTRKSLSIDCRVIWQAIKCILFNVMNYNWQLWTQCNHEIWRISI